MTLILTDVQRCKTNKNNRTANGANCRNRIRDGKNAHGKVDLAEHDGSALPIDRSEFENVIARLKDLAGLQIDYTAHDIGLDRFSTGHVHLIRRLALLITRRGLDRHD